MTTRSIGILLRGAAAWLLLIQLPACQLSAPLPQEEARPAQAALPPLPAEGGIRFVVDDVASDVRILVYRDGPLARIGHNHVIRVRLLRGEVYLASRVHQSAFALGFPVADLEVDPPDARADEGADFALMPPPQATEGTFGNLIGAAVLDAARYPRVELRSVSITGPEWGPEVVVRVTLRGVSRDIVAPVALHRDADTLLVTGHMRLRPSDFGIAPFSVLGGGLRVRNQVNVRFRLVARQAEER